MSQMISGVDVCDVFTVFHDGEVVQAELVREDLRIEVSIPYIANLIHPSFHTFVINVVKPSALKFVTWPNDAEAPPTTLTAPAEIFRPPLQILSGEPDGEGYRVIFNQPSPEFGYCGGDLYFKAEGAVVRDEAGTEHSAESLRALASAYWTKWEEQNARAAT